MIGTLNLLSGGGAVLEAMLRAGLDGSRVVASDYCRPLIAMYRALQSGWDPPESLSFEEWTVLRDRARGGEWEDPLIAFAGFGCSFGGKWFGGYARDPKSDRNYAGNMRNTLLKFAAATSSVRFHWRNYDAIRVPPRTLIYCDPPYAGTTGYGGVSAFDHSAFWSWCRRMSKDNGCTVLVSEYSAPSDFRLVWSMERACELKNRTGSIDKRVERLFLLP